MLHRVVKVACEGNDVQLFALRILGLVGLDSAHGVLGAAM